MKAREQQHGSPARKAESREHCSRYPRLINVLGQQEPDASTNPATAEVARL
jgi:hypothetical protein